MGGEGLFSLRQLGVTSCSSALGRVGPQLRSSVRGGFPCTPQVIEGVDPGVVPIGEADRERVVTDEGDLFRKEICGHGRWVVHSASGQFVNAVSARTEGSQLYCAKSRLDVVSPLNHEDSRVALCDDTGRAASAHGAQLSRMNMEMVGGTGLEPVTP